MAQQYGISEAELKTIKAQAANRAAMRKEFIKQSTNPWKHATGESGYVFDPALQRFMSMKVTQYDHFKPNRRTSLFGFFATVLPISLYAYLLHKERSERETLCRTGKVLYRDRAFKFQ